MKLSEAENRVAREEAARRVREKLENREKRLEDLRKGKTSLPEGIVRHREKIMKIFLMLAVICAFCIPFIKVNYDLTAYLPDDMESKKAINIMEEEFGYPGTARIMIENVTPYEAQLYQEMLENVDGVDMVSWIGSDIYMSGEFIDIAGQTDYYKDNCAVMDVTFTEGDTSELTSAALDEISAVLGEKGHYGGPAVENKSLQETLNVQIAIITAIAIVLIFLILCATTDSWAEPFLFLIVMGVAIVINMGSNILRGEISFISNSVAAVLQLAISIDYSIFLLHTFMREKEKEPDKEKAMANAIRHAAVSVLSSGMTTFVGFMALFFMHFLIGQDLGFVLGKSIISSIVTVLLFMPALILRFDALIARTQHKIIMPSFKRTSAAVFKLRYVVVVFIAIVFLPTYLMQNSNVNTYGNSALGASVGTVVYDDEQLIESKFGRSNLYLVLVPNGSPVTERELAGELKELSYVRSVTALSDILPRGVPEQIVPSGVTDLLRKEHYTRMLVFTRTKSESDLAFETSDEIQAIVKGYYPKEAYVVGNTPSTQDLKVICDADYAMVNAFSLVGVALVVIVAFQSLLLAVVAIVPISAAICINLAIPYLQGKVFMFAAMVVVSCIQLGATVDYSILLINNYLDRREKMKPKKAALGALQASMLSILTSGTILTVAGYAIYFVVSVEAIKDIGHMLGRGAILSMGLVLLAVPGLMTMLDKQIMKEREIRNRVMEKKRAKKEARQERNQKDESRIAKRRRETEKEDSLILRRLEKIEYGIIVRKMKEAKKQEKLDRLQEEKKRKELEIYETDAKDGERKQEDTDHEES
ncbi:MAG: MMPL family transporter [Lachnospiraceae bacterium]|jgi:predicted RND superfamily exporter protein|nr:MMPL family transporter [Lachnospiraceae bacterium]